MNIIALSLASSSFALTPKMYAPHFKGLRIIWPEFHWWIFLWSEFSYQQLFFECHRLSSYGNIFLTSFRNMPSFSCDGTLWSISFRHLYVIFLMLNDEFSFDIIFLHLTLQTGSLLFLQLLTTFCIDSLEIQNTCNCFD